jgi:transmembrane sensor
MNKQQIENQLQLAKIISDSLLKDIHSKDQLTLNNWLEISDDNKLLYQNFKTEKKFTEYKKIYEKLNFELAKQKIITSYRQKKLRRLNVSISKYAASFIICFGIFYYFIESNSQLSNADSAALVISEEDIILKMDNGEILVIDKNQNKKVRNKEGQLISTQKGDQLIYSNNNSTNKLVYNELHIPFGTKFHLTLSDGTLVHLNAGSTLKYPVQFVPGQERKVFVNGEAYFEVTKNKSDPFIVNTKNLNIKVLGTRFNVSAYDNDNSLNTVLVEGAVDLYDAKGKKKITSLIPGYMASLNKSENHILLKQVNTSDHTAWIDGKLILNNISFESIRKKLERRYNVTIVNNNKTLDKKTYLASFDIETIEQILNSFNENFAIDFTIKNNQIIIN